MLEVESKKYGDIVLLPYVDSYRGLIKKTMAMMVYVSKIDVKYLFKCDDDTYLKVTDLVNFLPQYDDKIIYMGHISSNGTPFRDASNEKWYISEEQYPYDLYPPFAHGPGYVVSRSLCLHFVVLYNQKQVLILVILCNIS